METSMEADVEKEFYGNHFWNQQPASINYDELLA